jgi:hypothetical protein
MALLNAAPSMLAPLRAGTASPALPGQGLAADGNAASRFGQVLSHVASGSSRVEVQTGDTLIGLVKAHYRQQGLPITESQAYRLAHQVAADNGIRNPDRILPGQSVDFARLQLPALARTNNPPGAAFTATENALASRHWRTASHVPATLTPGGVSSTGAPAASGMAAQDHPVLEQTLLRAVDKGFVPPEDLSAVRARVLAMSERFRFSPDDFARLTLMESGGMNPKASNGHCHGVIQFCDGPARGAASVGFRDNPKAILGVPLLQQLDLVERYFTQVGLGTDSAQAPLSLDDLYLSVLMPAARSEKRRDVALDIPGTQASYLHVDRDRQKPITRNSLVAGLYAHTNAVLLGGQARTAVQQWARHMPAPSLP